jgi:hypothetical protein
VPVAWNTMAAVSKESKPNKSIPSTSRIWAYLHPRISSPSFNGWTELVNHLPSFGLTSLRRSL